MSESTILLTPGPTPLPPAVREALARPIIHHRTAPYREIFKRTLQGMQTIIGTTQPVVLLTSSGTGAMETAVVNLCSTGDEAIVITGGKFGERWAHLCKAYGISATVMDVAYGKAVDPASVEKVLKEHPQAKAVFTTLCETSTGVTHDIQAIAAIAKRSNTVLVVDAISGLLADACKMDEWGIDVLVSGSQKGLMLPPGLAFLSLSERAWKLVDQSKTQKFYYDLKLARKALDGDDTPFTPAVSLVVALDEALKIVLSVGVAQRVSRFAVLAQGTRAAMEAMGLELFAERPSNGVTAVKVPEGIDGKKLTKTMYERSHVMIAGGQGSMAGKIFRFAHMGHIGPEDVLAGLRALEDALTSLGYAAPAGAGVKAAQAVFGQIAQAVRS